MAFPVVLLVVIGIALGAAKLYLQRERLPLGVQPLPGPAGELPASSFRSTFSVSLACHSLLI